MKRLVLSALAAALISTPALAAHWNVDSAKSKLGFGVQWSGQPFGATFKKWNAAIDFDPNDLAHAHVVATIDLASEASDSPDNDDGEAMANLTYRITSLFSGRDAVLGASAGLKHFGTRRLGRSGLAHRPPLVDAPPATDNVWDADCSSFFPPSVSGADIHGAYFKTAGTLELMRLVLRGFDRGVLETMGKLTGNAWPTG